MAPGSLSLGCPPVSCILAVMTAIGPNPAPLPHSGVIVCRAGRDAPASLRGAA